nr:hypothetical protein [Actinoplanes sp. ATCC 53533]
MASTVTTTTTAPEQGDRPSGAAAAGLLLVLLHPVAGREEEALGLVEPVGGPLLPGRQPAAAPQERVVAPVLLPLGGRLGQPAVGPQLLPVGGQPRAQPRPAADQHLVRDGHRVLGAGHQPGPGQLVEDAGGRRPAGQLRVRDVPAGVLGALAQGGQPQEDVLHDLLAGWFQLAEDPFRRPGHGLGDAARLPVAGEGQQPALAAVPGLQQRVRDQRQRAGLVGDVGQHRVHQRRLDPVAGPLGRAGDDGAQVGVVHRADQHLPVPQGRDQAGMPGAVRVEVRTHAEHDAGPVGAAGGDGQQAVQKQPPGAVVAAEREDLLELVDHDDQQVDAGVGGHRLPDGQRPVGRGGAQVGVQGRGGHALPGRQRGGQLLHRLGARGQHQAAGGPSAAGLPAGQRRHQAGAQQRGLAAARGAEDGQERPLGQPAHQLAHLRPAAEEPLGVPGLEGRQAQVRRLLRRDGGPGQLGGQLLPAPLPLLPVAAAALHVRQGDRQRGQRQPGRRLGQHGRRIVHAGRQLAIAGPAGPQPQLAQLPREALQRTGLRIDLTFGTPHRRPPYASI